MELLYWQLVYFFVKKQYRIIKLANDPKEIWLASFGQHAPLVRLVCYDVDWSSWLARDLEYTKQVAIQLQKRPFRRSSGVLNIYVSTYPPVDDWEWIVANATDDFPQLHTVLLHSGNAVHALQQISDVLREPVVLESVAGEVDPFLAAQHVQRLVFRLEKERRETEERVLDYGRPLFTYVFIVLQMVMFLLLEAHGGSTNPDVLIRYGAKFNPLMQQEWWRFITPIFLHIGFFHLLMNTMALYYLGMTTERLYGSFRFCFIYLVAGFFGTLGSFLFTTSLSAGASGAIFGLFGALLYFGTVYRHLFFQTMGTNIIGLIVLNLGLGLLLPGIDNAGHIGGLIGGFLAAGIVHLPRHRLWKRQLAAFVFTVLLIAVGLSIGFQ
ncbi:rhomboid family intramembrane serine protease [Anoxybacteroides amylolyticum]|uniref:Rhomboid family protein n=1 Tax=Anoxybacteroides amylolyticum TaxID=294699 RepID=A0A161HUA8_9BACL|nr:rhomboid family intramembrane serine protease [Anoxybacillus amylolyticus]ANB60434.1 rhomboid family protein [Anoxybacillus amylolyticus]